MSVGKLQRTYRLDIRTPDDVLITIEPPFTIQFNIVRNTLASANKAEIVLYNLGPSTRSQIFKDRFSTTEYFQVSLFAGYGNRLHQVFLGNILEASSYRERTEWITTINAFDGLNAIQNGFTAQSFAAGTGTAEILGQISQNLPNIVRGIFGLPAEGTAPRGQVFIGQSTQAINELTDGDYYIDNEELNVLARNEAIPGVVTRLDPSVLLETPRRQDALLEVTTLFEPNVRVGQIYEIESLEPIYNGQYLVQGFTHNVVISEAESGEARTDLMLFFGADGIREAQPV